MQHMLASYILNGAWQVPIVAFCAFIISRFAGLSPRSRNHFWIAALLTAAVLPMVSLNALLPHFSPSVARVPVGAPVDTQALAALHPVAATDPIVSLPSWSVWTMTGLFVALALALLLRLTRAAVAARGLVRQSASFSLPPDLIEAVDAIARDHGRRSPQVRRSCRISSPAMVGVLRPVILIPEAMTFEGEDLRAALLHEMAHIVRHDYAINLACELLTLPICWHPAHLGIKSGVRRSRELACDDIAAAAMASPKAYAKCLVSLARTLGGQTSAHPTLALAVGLFGRSDLEERLMHLTRPRDVEAPAIRAARLCGLAAVGASLVGSAALLHVTPVFAQSSPPAAAPPSSVKATPAPAPVTSAPLDRTQDDAPKPSARHHRGGLLISRDGVVIETSSAGYRHSFTGLDGRTLTVTNDDPNPPTADEQRRWEEEARKAEAKAAEVEKRINSPEFKQRIERAQARAAEAEKMVNSPEFQARISKAVAQAAEVQKRVNSPEFQARISKAVAQAAEVQKRVNSPEFQARIKKATERAAEFTTSAEFKADIEAAAAAAEKDVNSPEFRTSMAKLQAALAAQKAQLILQREELRHQRDELKDREAAKPDETP